ncbi:hypothetical protein Q8F55_004441 [Vanrija albida]|uniref:Uncharacterized protein n=1 Tax=Vanrija albida TaxID=181172 RepID=A0ABR3Q6R4_9TREE
MGYSWGEELSAETSNECGAPGEFVEPDGLKPGEKYPKPCFQNVFKPKINRVHFKIYERDYCSVDSEWVYLRDGYAEVPILNHVATLNKGKKVPDGSWDCTRECQELAVDLSLMCTAKGSS